MPLFVCPKCNCVENTALGQYHWNVANGDDPVCSECHSGKWHHHFPKRNHDGKYDCNFMEFITILGFNEPGEYTIEQLSAMDKH